MAYYKLIREKSLSASSSDSSKAVHGHLYRVEHTYSGWSGEYIEHLIPICSTLENRDYLIPALVYRVSVTQSPCFKRLLPILLQVPGRTGIRIHRGTRPQHSKGCILVSASDEQSLTARFLSEQSAHEDTRLEICDP